MSCGMGQYSIATLIKAEPKQRTTSSLQYHEKRIKKLVWKWGINTFSNTGKNFYKICYARAGFKRQNKMDDPTPSNGVKHYTNKASAIGSIDASSFAKVGASEVCAWKPGASWS
jgi:hypothetical protein